MFEQISGSAQGFSGEEALNFPTILPYIHLYFAIFCFKISFIQYG